MKAAALGFRAHSGWTALVAVSLDGDSPQVLLRQRPHLVKSFTFEFRQPYHTAEKKALAEGRAFVSRMEAEAAALACEAIREAQREVRKQGYTVGRCGLLLASGRLLPELKQILASHALIHTADGELFRKALMNASEACGCTVYTAKESGLVEEAGQTLGHSQKDLARRLTGLGSTMGAPWAQDEKLSALVSWMALLNDVGEKSRSKPD
jgi:hypothetical protein